LSIVFEEGGGPSTEINFGMVYFGQAKECSAFLVNNGPKEIAYKFFFHPDKRKEDNLDDSDFACTPEQAGIEMTQRILAAEPLSGAIKPYSQIPIKFLCKTKIPEKKKGWRGHLSEEYDLLNKDHNNQRHELSKPLLFKSTAAVKFDEAHLLRNSAKDSEERICPTISVYMEVKAIFPDITLNMMSVNFHECDLFQSNKVEIFITNKNEELPIDFNFNKISHFHVTPSSGIIHPSSKSVPIVVAFNPKNYGNYSDFLTLRYVNNMYSINVRVMGVCKDKGNLIVKIL
jgi:hypothetical protein